MHSLSRCLVEEDSRPELIFLMELAKLLAALLEVYPEVEVCLSSSHEHQPEVLTALTTSSHAGRFLRRVKAKQGPVSKSLLEFMRN